MKAAIIVFPGSNCDRDLAEAFRKSSGIDPVMVWHKETALPDGIDIVGIPGGFSFGDYLRCGAIAAQSPVAGAIKAFAEKGGPVLGVCNGFQVLCETGLLPGALMRNASLKYICRSVGLRVETTDTPYTGTYAQGDEITVPIAHHDGNYRADPGTLDMLEAEARVAFRYVDNPNGSDRDIAGIVSENRRVLGMMPHPERAYEPLHGGTDGARLFTGLLDALSPA
ncbi:phosphoribosylformylglycinamidine synthase subunit PurQ [Tropicimonas sp. S265A]|uniref:phosphoribosylformylglycinamidine synthase subunit PurQ n=1 Tax=Tropicimonas sp. S265A TaxID=3415134 RepID=UPI003C7E32A6